MICRVPFPYSVVIFKDFLRKFCSITRRHHPILVCTWGVHKKISNEPRDNQSYKHSLKSHPLFIYFHTDHPTCYPVMVPNARMNGGRDRLHSARHDYKDYSTNKNIREYTVNRSILLNKHQIVMISQKCLP